MSRHKGKKKVAVHVPDAGLYLRVAEKDKARAIEMVEHSELTFPQKRAMIRQIRSQPSGLDIQEPKNY